MRNPFVLQRLRSRPMHRLLYRLICATGRVAVLLSAVRQGRRRKPARVSMPAMAFGNVNVLAGAAVDTTSDAHGDLLGRDRGRTADLHQYRCGIGERCNQPPDDRARAATRPVTISIRTRRARHYGDPGRPAMTLPACSWMLRRTARPTSRSTAGSSHPNRPLLAGVVYRDIHGQSVHSIRQQRWRLMSDRRPVGEHVDIRDRNRDSAAATSAPRPSISDRRGFWPATRTRKGR